MFGQEHERHHTVAAPVSRLLRRTQADSSAVWSLAADTNRRQPRDWFLSLFVGLSFSHRPGKNKRWIGDDSRLLVVRHRLGGLKSWEVGEADEQQEVIAGAGCRALTLINAVMLSLPANCGGFLHSQPFLSMPRFGGLGWGP
jgi:hypothetical protein